MKNPSAHDNQWRGWSTPHWTNQGAALYCGDVREQLRRLPARSVHCAMTSPPYWGLRDYGVCQCATWLSSYDSPTSTLNGGGNVSTKGKEPDPNCPVCNGTGRIDGTEVQLGLEKKPDCLGWATGRHCNECYVCSMVKVFRELWRVLRDDGTLWLNLGDSYGQRGGDNCGGFGPKCVGGKAKHNTRAKFGLAHNNTEMDNGVPAGNLIGIPWRVALAMQASGWVLRSAMPWVKPNPMPDSITSRPGKAVEDVFLFTKGTEYYFDMEAVRVPSSGKSGGASFGKQDFSVDGTGAHSREYNRQDEETRQFRSSDLYYLSLGFDVPTAPYPGAHFAVWPEKLVTPMILAGTSECGCCVRCGAQYDRIVKKSPSDFARNGPKDTPPGQTPQSSQRRVIDESRDHSMRRNRNGIGSTFDEDQGMVPRITIGWHKPCGCATKEIVPAVVLDPFVGSGTTVATAVLLGRRGVGIDLSEEYIKNNAVPRITAALKGERLSRNTATVIRDAEPPVPKSLWE